ncbi:heparinase II/III domain-containing protein [Bifidobacterium callimiconis]|uniref:Heparinase n=1 Tax=Bifidobacterium callimiconis TaxID=2306973 RepID=A0A430F9J9_9BIFI|nr:heparinase II/III family protein [Bifidobacterium callimiconis]MBT1175962.1 heparinase II/III family protein [Bifidobacterium callimiconis]RSX49506.1 heparinase [Bifidobacterium callimiconis]
MSAESIMRLQRLAAHTKAVMNDPDAVYPQGALDGVADMLDLAERVIDGTYRRPFSHSHHFLPDIDAADFVTRFHTMITGWQTPGDMERTYGLADAADWLSTQDLAALPLPELRDRVDTTTARARQVLDSVKSGTALGNVNPERYRDLETALAACETTVNAVSPDHRALARRVADCMDAIRNCLASRVLACDLTDGDDLPALFFSSADERAALIERIRSDEFLSARYRDIKAIADEWRPSDADAMAGLCRDDVDYAAADRRFRMWASSESEYNFVTPADAVSATIEIALPATERYADGRSFAWIDQLRIASAQEGDWALLNPGFDGAADHADSPEEAADVPAHWVSRSTAGSLIRRDARELYRIGEGASLYLENPDLTDGAVGTDVAGTDVAGTDIVDAGATAIPDASGFVGARAVNDQPISVPANTACTLAFMGKLDGVMPHGLHIRLRFLNADCEECGAEDWDFNRAAALWQVKGPGRGPALSAQTDAIVAFMESDRDPAAARVYAIKAKNEIMLELDDFCQGAEHWMVNNARPYGCDSYGAVQAGRILCSVAATLTLIQSFHVFSDSETARFLDLIDVMLLYVTDARDRTAYPADEILLGATNWQTDMMAGAAVISLALLDAGILDPARALRARRMIADGTWFLKAQVDDHVNPDGAFPESLRYHMAALSRYTFVAGVLGRGTGDDWYRSTRLRDMFRYYADMVTPPYAYKKGRRSTPTFGDHQLGDGTEFAQLGLHASDVAAVDPALAQQMRDLWLEAGRPVPPFSTEAVAFEHLLPNMDPVPGHEPYDWAPLHSTAAYPDSGIALFRKAFGTPHEQFLAVMSSPRPIGHGHFDQGSFIYYKDCVPIVVDPGIIGYFDTSKDWLYSSSAHATMQFASRYGRLEQAAVTVERLDESLYSRQFGYVDTPRSSRVLDVHVGGVDVSGVDGGAADGGVADGSAADGAAEESITIAIDNPEGAGTQIRTITWFPEPELILVHDRVRDFDGTVRFTLPLAATTTEETSSRGAVSSAGGVREFTSACDYGLRLQTLFLTPVDTVTCEWGTSSPVAPPVNGRDQLQFLRAETQASQGFTVLLNAMHDGEPKAHAAWSPDGALYLTKGPWTHTLHPDSSL